MEKERIEFKYRAEEVLHFVLKGQKRRKWQLLHFKHISLTNVLDNYLFFLYLELSLIKGLILTNSEI